MSLYSFIIYVCHCPSSSSNLIFNGIIFPSEECWQCTTHIQCRPALFVRLQYTYSLMKVKHHLTQSSCFFYIFNPKNTTKKEVSLNKATSPPNTPSSINTHIVLLLLLRYQSKVIRLFFLKTFIIDATTFFSSSLRPDKSTSFCIGSSPSK